MRGHRTNAVGVAAGVVGFVLVVWLSLALAGGVTDTALSAWSWLRGTDSNATTLRNVLLGIGGPLAVVMAWWRSSVSQRTLLNERYQKGAEMLGSAMMAVRLGGVYALGELAREHPKIYHVQVLKLFCAYVRTSLPAERSSDGTEGVGRLLARQDIQDVMDWIGRRRRRQRRLEADGVLNLVQADLSGLILPPDSNLAGALLAEANLSRSSFAGSDLTGALLYGATLTNAILDDANLSDADLRGASLLGASLKGARLDGAKLSGAQLDRANLSDTSFGDTFGRNGASGMDRAQLDGAMAPAAKPRDLGNDADDT